MKKWIVMLAVLVMFCLAGCGEKPMTQQCIFIQMITAGILINVIMIFSGTRYRISFTDEWKEADCEEDMTDGDVSFIRSMEMVSCCARDSIRESQYWYGRTGQSGKAYHYRKELPSLMRPDRVSDKKLF